MPNPLIVTIHPDDLAAGVALIGAAADAVRQPGGGLVAAWDYRAIFPSAEAILNSLLHAAGASLACPCRCFGLLAAHPRRPGLVPTPRLDFRPTTPVLFEEIVTALAEDVANGSAGLIVSKGLSVRPDTLPPFLPGVLHIRPTNGGGIWLTAHDPFTAAGFPTLTFSRLAERLSAHEILDRCGQLAVHMAATRHVVA